jgi:inhibitor of cysteine peptidase
VFRTPCLPKKIWAWSIAGLTLGMIAGCPWLTPAGDTDATDAKLVAFRSADELLGYFREQARTRTSARWSFGLGDFGAQALPGAATTAEEDNATDDTGGEAGDSSIYSTTNVQEAGVDESDVVKSDGTYFYIARAQTLRVVRARPADELAEVGRLDLEVHVSEMYLYGSTLLLLAQRYEQGSGGWEEPAIASWPPYYVGSGLTLVEVDISDPTAPTVIKQTELDGMLVDSRLTNDRLILVLTIAPEVPEDATILQINAMPLDDFLPKLRAGTTERNMVGWQECLHPESPDGYYMTAVLTLDAADIESILNSVVVVAGAGTIYASTEALYITDTDYDADDDYREMTAIHKFAFDDDGAAEYVASGSVPGRLLNQFSLGEFEGYLRLATHVTNPVFFGWGVDAVAVDVVSTAQDIEAPDEYNAVYVLGQNGAELETVGAIEDIAPNEDLHSARFIGTRGFLVTFHRIDPLFALDLSDPTNPEIKGELQIPGYSDYLHPLGDDYLIGVGRTVVTMSSWGGEEPGAVQLSLFDVSDLSNPMLVQQLELGGMHSWSFVTQTHKAFTLMPEQGLLAIPMRLTEEGTTYYEYDLDPFYGVVCFDVDPETGFTERGRLAAVNNSEDYYEAWYPGDYPWFRAAFIGDTLYALSADGVAAAPTDALTDATTLALEE